MRSLLFLALGPLAAGCLCGGPNFSGENGPPPYDCEAVPRGPFEATPIPHPVVFEDLVFDGEGNLVGWRDDALFKTPRSGTPAPFAAGVPAVYGLRYLSTGDLVAADGATGSLLRVEPNGTSHTVLSGLNFPNGLAVDLADQVYVGEFSGNRIRKVDPITGEFEMILDGDVPNPNGLSFDPTYRILYIGGWLEHVLYTLAINEDGTPGALEAWEPDTLGGLLHAMATDLCGNVYVSEIFGGGYGGGYGGTVVYRLPPEGGEREILFNSDDTGETGILISNIEWGAGFGGWSDQSLFLGRDYTGGVYELPLGVPSKPRPFPPPPEEE